MLCFFTLLTSKRQPQVSGLPFNQVSKQVLPFLLVMLAVLMAVTFVPGITLLLPKLLGLPL